MAFVAELAVTSAPTAIQDGGLLGISIGKDFRAAFKKCASCRQALEEAREDSQKASTDVEDQDEF